jgi:hypothetical protein
MSTRLPKPGDKVMTWFSGEPDKLSTVLEVLPYTGIYPEHFSCVVRVTSNSPKGSAEMAWERNGHIDVKKGAKP